MNTPLPSELLPVFLKLENKDVLVVGAGQVALEKITGLKSTGAVITVISPAAVSEIEDLAKSGELNFIQREVLESDLRGRFMVYVATGVAEVNGRLRQYADEHNILLNVVDDRPYCDFYSAAVVKRGPWRIAVSTQGTFAGLASMMQRVLSAIVPDESLEDWDSLVTFRKKLAKYIKTQPKRTAYLRKLLKKIQKKVL